tara:strand:+ start:1383 stop:1562 length:180 start_codon:yes stop_codon:yes gene_type:complete
MGPIEKREKDVAYLLCDITSPLKDQRKVLIIFYKFFEKSRNLFKEGRSGDSPCPHKGPK